MAMIGDEAFFRDRIDALRAEERSRVFANVERVAAVSVRLLRRMTRVRAIFQNWRTASSDLGDQI
jgi:hypothetical protein